MSGLREKLQDSITLADARSAALHMAGGPARNAIWKALERLQALLDAQDPKQRGYPTNVNNPDDWAAFMAGYAASRTDTPVADGLGLIALHIVEAIKDARKGEI